MNDPLSSHAIIYAILALNSEIALQKDYIESPGLSEEERADEQDTLDDMEQAFMEFVGVYKTRCKQDRSLPDIDELLTTDI